jgi:hypothetical protein
LQPGLSFGRNNLIGINDATRNPFAFNDPV